MKSQEQIDSAERGILGGEEEYLKDWVKDTKRWEALGLYLKVAEFAAPQNGRFTVDIGTGLGMQLVFLAAANERGLYVGTERTPRNVELAKRYLNELGLDAVTMLLTQGLAVDAEDRLFWEQRHLPHLKSIRPQIRAALEQQVLLMDDDIRRPQSLPVVLDGEKVDTAILSLPGGSASRAYEWPFVAEQIDQHEVRRRTVQVSNDTRAGFYHFASQTVRDGGKAIVAERLTSDDTDGAGSALALISQQMGPYAKYWRAGRVAMMKSNELPQQVTLLATHEGRQLGKADLQKYGLQMRLAIIELFRNKKAFDEAPLPEPRK